MSDDTAAQRAPTSALVTRSLAICWRSRSARVAWQSSTAHMTSDLTAGLRSRCSLRAWRPITAFRTRFIRRSRAAATVEHPNIIPVYDAGDAGGCLFISMRYVQGGDVRSLLADGKGLPPARAWNIINQVGSALDMAHSHNLVHRDVKPANMLIDASAKDVQGDVNTSGPVTEHIYLSDFGISKQTVASNLTSTGQFVGTLDYIAPEQIEGQAIDGRADEYSLACAAFELLCGARRLLARTSSR